MAEANIEEKENDLENERNDAAIVVVDSPGVTRPAEEVEQNNNQEDEPEQNVGNQINERPHRERRPPDWFVDYQMNF